jgi:hypothetical protein
MLSPQQPQGAPQGIAQPSQPKGSPEHQKSPSIAKEKNAATGQSAQVNHVAQQADSLGRSPTANGQYDTQSQQALQKHIQSLPPQQKQFVQHYLCPETLTLVGILVGAEVYDLLKPMTNPRLQAIIIPRQMAQQPPGGGGQPPQQGLPPGGQSQGQPQPQQNSPAPQAPANAAPQAPQQPPQGQPQPQQ